MRGGRWYPSLVTLPDARVLALSGHPENSDASHNNNRLEIFDGVTWADIGESPEVQSAAGYLYPRICIGPTGAVFSATPLVQEYPGVPGSSGSWMPGAGVNWTRHRTALPVGAKWGDYDGYHRPGVLLPLIEEEANEASFRFQFLLAGGAAPWVIDLGTPLAPQAAPRWQELGSGHPDRFNSNLVLLPSGEVLLCGGVSNSYDDSTAQREPELLVRTGTDWQWEPAQLAAATVPRNYHSTALLTPEGRVFTGGSNIGSGPGGRDKRRLEIEFYDPWYLCQERPRITAAPAEVRAGERFEVQVRGPGPITRLVLIRCGSSTHGYDTDARCIVLLARRTGPNAFVAAVPGESIAIPGYYMLFARTDRNVPSRGVFIRVRRGR